MIVLEIIGVLAVVGIATGLLKLLIAGIFEGASKVGEVISNQTSKTTLKNRPFWEEYLIEPYRYLINSLNQVQKTALFFTMVDVATVDGPGTPFELAYIESFRNAFALDQSQIEGLFKNKFAGLSENQYTLMFNGVICSLTVEQKEWFLKVLDRMTSHGPRIPTGPEMTKILCLAEDIGVNYERFRELI